jgi:hypothetical protein
LSWVGQHFQVAAGFSSQYLLHVLQVQHSDACAKQGKLVLGNLVNRLECGSWHLGKPSTVLADAEIAASKSVQKKHKIENTAGV